MMSQNNKIKKVLQSINLGTTALGYAPEIIAIVRHLIQAIIRAMDRGESVDQILARIDEPRQLDMSFRKDIDEQIEKLPRKRPSKWR